MRHRQVSLLEKATDGLCVLRQGVHLCQQLLRKCNRPIRRRAKKRYECGTFVYMPNYGLAESNKAESLQLCDTVKQSHSAVVSGRNVRKAGCSDTTRMLRSGISKLLAEFYHACIGTNQGLLHSPPVDKAKKLCLSTLQLHDNAFQICS